MSGADTEAVVPKPAVSVLMLRGDAPELEVFIQHRVMTMDFAPGAVVFPGGRVDEGDYAAGSDGVARSAGTDGVARSTGTVQAGDILDKEVLERHAQAWQQTAAAANGAEALLEVSAALLAAAIREIGEETGAVLSPGELRPWANWVTPPGGPKRFDTYFYLAVIGPSIVPAHQTTEASASHWWPVRKVLDEAAAGNLQLLRPTYVLLTDLASFDSTHSLTGSNRPIIPNRDPLSA